MTTVRIVALTEVHLRVSMTKNAISGRWREQIKMARGQQTHL